MDSLFAPWRMEWVDRDRSEDDADVECLFCHLPERGNDADNLVVARSDHCYVVLNNMPYNPGHVMTVPFDHEGEFHRLEETVLVDCMRTTQRVMAALEESLAPEGFNVGINLNAAGGASITDHMHVHVIPRWESDTSFMPLTANTAIVEEAVRETYDRVREALLLEDHATRGEGTDAVVLDGD